MTGRCSEGDTVRKRVRTLRPIDKYMIKDVPRHFREEDTEPIELDHVSLCSGGLEVEMLAQWPTYLETVHVVVVFPDVVALKCVT